MGLTTNDQKIPNGATKICNLGLLIPVYFDHTLRHVHPLGSNAYIKLSASFPEANRVQQTPMSSEVLFM
jgi:hypothetical protein